MPLVRTSRSSGPATRHFRRRCRQRPVLRRAPPATSCSLAVQRRAERLRACAVPTSEDTASRARAVSRSTACSCLLARSGERSFIFVICENPATCGFTHSAFGSPSSGGGVHRARSARVGDLATFTETCATREDASSLPVRAAASERGPRSPRRSSHRSRPVVLPTPSRHTPDPREHPRGASPGRATAASATASSDPAAACPALMAPQTRAGSASPPSARRSPAHCRAPRSTRPADTRKYTPGATLGRPIRAA